MASANTPNSIGQPEDSSEFEEVDEELSNDIIQHPDAFSRVLDRPEIQQIVVAHHAFQGPLPPPDLLRGYQDILPDAPERIFQLTEKEFSHRQRMEEKALDLVPLAGIKEDSILVLVPRSLRLLALLY
jgi:hypothetical protein